MQRFTEAKGVECKNGIYFKENELLMSNNYPANKLMHKLITDVLEQFGLDKYNFNKR